MNNMKLEIGMYVRTERGNIFKVNTLAIIDKDGIYFKSIVKENGVIQDIPSLGYLDHENREMINGASHNIIDLLQVGDFIDHLEIMAIEGDYIVLREATFTKNGLKNYGIKSIVTKEQFSQMEYKVGE